MGAIIIEFFMWIIDLDEFPSCNDLLSQFGILSKGHSPILPTCSYSSDIVVDLHRLLLRMTCTELTVGITNSMEKITRCKELCGCGQMPMDIFSLN